MVTSIRGKLCFMFFLRRYFYVYLVFTVRAGFSIALFGILYDEYFNFGGNCYLFNTLI